MDLSKEMQIILYRCKSMNCVNEGQTISLGMFDSDFGGRDLAADAMKTAVGSNIVNEGRNNTYVLTGIGAEALAKSVYTPKTFKQGNFRQNTRPPVNKLQ